MGAEAGEVGVAETCYKGLHFGEGEGLSGADGGVAGDCGGDAPFPHIDGVGGGLLIKVEVPAFAGMTDGVAGMIRGGDAI